MITRPVFIVGSGRSGTSLMRSLVNADPLTAIAPETHFFDRWLPAHWQGADQESRTTRELLSAWERHTHLRRVGLPENALVAMREASSPRQLYTEFLDAYAELTGATVVGEKGPAYFRYLDQILEWFPDARIVFVARDPRGVVGSLHALEEPWARGTTPRHLRLWEDAADAASRWLEDPRVLLVRYEDLVAQPAAVMSDVHPALTGHPFDADWLRERGEKPDCASQGSRSATSAVATDRIESWRGRISEGEAAVIAYRERARMRALGYEPTAGMPSCIDRSKFAVSSAVDLVKRAARSASSPTAMVRRLRFRRHQRHKAHTGPADRN